MSDVEELKQSADKLAAAAKESTEKLAAAAKESTEKLAAAAKETAEVGVKVFRDRIHDMVKDPTTVDKMKQMEETFDRQVEQATKQIEDGAKQLMSFWSGLVQQAQPESREQPKRVEVEVEPSDKP